MSRSFQTGVAALVLVAMASAAPAHASHVSTSKPPFHRWLDTFWTAMTLPETAAVRSRPPAVRRDLKAPRFGRPESLPQADGSYIDPNGGKGSVLELPPDPVR
jgi:hypothetical protein